MNIYTKQAFLEVCLLIC